MKEKNLSTVISEIESSETTTTSAGEGGHHDQQGLVERRSFLKGLGIAGVALSAGALVATGAPERQHSPKGQEAQQG
jgi:hypothetical protein